MEIKFRLNRSIAVWGGVVGLVLLTVFLTITAMPLVEPRVEAAPMPAEVLSEQPAMAAAVEAAQEAAPAEKIAAVEAKAKPAQAVQAQNSTRSYRGDIFARDTVQVGVEVIGQVLQLNVAVGDSVEMGDLLLQIDDTTLVAQRSQALAGLEAAEAQLNQLLLDADESDIRAARAAVSAANAGYQRAVEGPTQEDLNIAEAQRRQAEALVKQAQSAYNEIAWMPNRAMMPQTMALEQATLQLESAKAAYQKIENGSTPDIINGAYAQLASAQAQLDRLLSGANEPQLDAVRAQVRQAETALLLSDIQVAKAAVHAPISGLVNQVNTTVGANVAPGPAVFELLSKEVEVVIDVEELRRGEIQVGQPATIRANAYPDRTFAGEVVSVAPSLNATTRTFEVAVKPIGDAGELAPGMSATVELGN